MIFLYFFFHKVPPLPTGITNYLRQTACTISSSQLPWLDAPSSRPGNVLIPLQADLEVDKKKKQFGVNHFLQLKFSSFYLFSRKIIKIKTF